MAWETLHWGHFWVSNLPEVAGSAKIHRCYTIRSWAVWSSPVGSKQKTFPLRTAAHRKVMFLSYLSSYLFPFTPISLPLFSPRHRSDHCSTFFFVFLQNGHCFVLLIYVTAVECPPRSTSYFFTEHYALSSIPSPWVCLSHLDTLHCQLSQGRMPPTEHCSTPSGTGRGPGALASRRGPAGSGLSSSPARGCRTAVPAGVSPHHPTPCCPLTSSFLVSEKSKRWKRRVHRQFLPNLPEPRLLGEWQEKHLPR